MNKLAQSERGRAGPRVGSAPGRGVPSRNPLP